MNTDNHIFAIEGEWETKLDKELTIKSTLSLLQEVCNIDSIFRKTNTVNSLLKYLEITSAASYKKYGTIVIATHGTRKDIELTESEYITIKKLGKHCAGLFKEKIVHFSSCGVMKNADHILAFKEITHAKAVCGYSKNVNFLESSVFDILLLDRLFQNNSPKITNKFLLNNYPQLVEKLGFKMIT
jgi:hypothetical protein